MPVQQVQTNAMQLGVGASGSPITGNFTIGTGANLCAFAVLAFDGMTSVTSVVVTLGGQSMTSCGALVHNATGDEWVQVFSLVNPPTGTQTLSVTITANNAIGDLYFNAVTFIGVDQATPVRPGSYQTGTGAGSTASLVISSDPNDLTLTCINGGSAGVTGTNQTSDGINTGGNYGGGSDHATTGASSVTHTWSGVGNNAMAGFSIQAAGAAGGDESAFVGEPQTGSSKIQGGLR